MIFTCALAVITDRGRHIVPPSVSSLAKDEEDFLQRHIDSLRGEATKEGTPLARFRGGSTVRDEFELALYVDVPEFLEIASGFVESLAKAMLGAPKARDCVVALVTDGKKSGPEHVSLLKLDAEIEAAQLEQLEKGIRLHVFRDLLPRPGDLQKGLSWPDPRGHLSEVIIKDRNAGHTAYYFQNAFGIDESAAALDTERALINSLAESLPSRELPRALNLVREGGPANKVVERLQSEFPNFKHNAPELGAAGAMAGQIRPRNVRAQKLDFHADGIDLRVPVELLGRVRTIERDGGFETFIRTSVPLTPVSDPDL